MQIGSAREDNHHISPKAVKETDRLRKTEYTEGRVDGDDLEDEAGVNSVCSSSELFTSCTHGY